METVSFLCAFTLTVLGCPHSETVKATPQTKQLEMQFSQADATLASYLVILSVPTTTQQTHKKIICQDFPSVYQQQYLPLALKLEYNPEPILQSMQRYQVDYKIKCE
ncbi:hypothetical protein [Acinetobacter sp. MD2(2019)]|uniref:hypothetical protein n=1 Tax=Acinetobacter sp. MD2(2019) TaxID=2605273 RepID=UPI002D1EE320|nr:hypothetical protein [Acinetobacter sp. MD2(2019)]MEB3753399.1 hypothetical protein [Acinetobacter sp. MD2(2019)]